MTAPLNLTVNGEPRKSSAATIAALVRELELKPEKVAVERNGTIVPRSTLAEAPPEIVEELSTNCDVVIAGVGD